MAGSPGLKNAFIVHGLALTICGAAVLAGWIGPVEPTTEAFILLGLIAAPVLCLWSFLLSIHAVRNGAKWRWASVIWTLASVELIGPTTGYYWSDALRINNWALGMVVGVLLPVAVSGALYAVTAIRIVQKSKHPRTVLSMAVILFLPVIIIIAPGAAYLVTVLTPEPVSTGPQSISLYPEILRDSVDRSLAIRTRGILYEYHLHLCMYGLLSRDRTVENFCSLDFNVSSSAWWALQSEHPNAALSIAVDLALAKFCSPIRNSYRSELGSLLGEKGSAQQISEVLRNLDLSPAEFKLYFIAHLLQRFDCFALIERTVVHRECTDPDVLDLLSQIIARPTQEGRFLKHKRWTLSDWSTAKRASGLLRLNSLKSLVESCRSESDSILRRLAATALADVLNTELHHTPFADELTPDGKPVPVTLDESEELEQLCNAAQAEVDKLPATPKQ